MGCIISCETQDANLSTPIGSCGCAKTICTCFKTTDSPISETSAAEESLKHAIEDVLKLQLASMAVLTHDVEILNDNIIREQHRPAHIDIDEDDDN